MPEQTVTIRLPPGFDRLVKKHCRPPKGTPFNAGEFFIDDDVRRAYVCSILAAVIEGLHAPTVADGLIRLNGGFIIREGDPRVH